MIFFLLAAFAFQLLTSALLGPEGRFSVTDNNAALLGLGSPTAWKNALSIILLPIKLILIGPLLPFINFLRQDPDTPPPFYLLGFAMYWTILALICYNVMSRLKSGKTKQLSA